MIVKWSHFLYLFLRYGIKFSSSLHPVAPPVIVQEKGSKRKSEKLSFSFKVTFLLWLNEKREKDIKVKMDDYIAF